MEFRVQRSKGETCPASRIKGQNTREDSKRPLGHLLPRRWTIKLSKANDCLGAKASGYLHLCPFPTLHCWLLFLPSQTGLQRQGLSGGRSCVCSNRQLLRRPRLPAWAGSVVLRQAERMLLYVDSFMLGRNARQTCFLDPPSLGWETASVASTSVRVQGSRLTGGAFQTLCLLCEWILRHRTC